MQTKKCCVCKEDKILSEFSYKNKKRRSLSSKCKECTKAYGRKHYQNNKDDYNRRARVNCKKYIKRNQQNMLEYLSKRRCSKCGEDDPVVLQFHHLDRDDKKEAIACLVQSSYSWDVIMAEIEKCDILCANCHMREHSQKQGWYRGQVRNFGKAAELKPQ